MSSIARQKEVDEMFARITSEGLTDDEAVLRLYRDNGVGLMFLWKTLSTHRGLERKEAMKRALEATRLQRDLEGRPNNLAMDAAHCPTCGEKIFIALPGRTTKAELIEFASHAKICQGSPIAEEAWIHPGRYCPNGCIEELWELAAKKSEPDVASNSRPPSLSPLSPQVQSCDSQRTPSSGACG